MSLIDCYNKNTHRIHGSADTLGAVSGRFTHNSPNITQVPKSKGFRELFCVPDDKLLVDIDADALELVMLGHYLGEFDDYEFAKIVAHGSKAKGDDIHTINQKKLGLLKRDLAKTFIYATIYGAGALKIGDAVYSDDIKFTFDYNKEKELLLKLKQTDNGLINISKDTFKKFDNKLVNKYAYGKFLINEFALKTKGYTQLVNKLTNQINKDKSIVTLDGRKIYMGGNSSHKALNVLLQSSGAIFMKYYLVTVDKHLKETFKDDEYHYIANIHDAINLEINPDIQDKIKVILENSFLEASNQLGLTYQVKGTANFGKSQYETH